jgi:DNA-binding transcriptional LysR family regulator
LFEDDMIRDVDITLLRAFVAVVDTGSVTAAARLLNRTQAAVSLQIKRLEELFGTPLFHREHRKLRLTPEGERLVSGAERIVSANDELWGRMTTQHFAGEVRLGAPSDIVPTYIPPILRRFSQAWPRVRVTLCLSNSQTLLEEMGRGDNDVVLTTDVASDPVAECLRLDHLVWVGAPGTRVHEIDPLPITIGDATCRFRPVVLDALSQMGRDWRLVTEVANQVAQNAVIGAGIAVSAMLRDSVPDDLAVIPATPLLPKLPDFAINMHLPALGPSPVAAELARHIRAEFAQRFGTRAASQAA